VINGVLT